MLRITAIQLHQLFCISLLTVCLIPCRSLFDCWCSLREREQESRAHVCAWGWKVGRCLNSWMKVVYSCRFLLQWALEDRPQPFSMFSELCFWKDGVKAISNTCNNYVILHPHWGSCTPKKATKNLQNLSLGVVYTIIVYPIRSTQRCYLCTLLLAILSLFWLFIFHLASYWSFYYNTLFSKLPSLRQKYRKAVII